MRYIFGLMTIAALSACNTKIPDSAAHLPAQDVQSNAPLSAMIEGEEVAGQSLDAAPAAVPPAKPFGNTRISDEQDFEAVTSRETIESDAARRAQNQAQYKQVEVTDLPKRSGDTTVTIVDYALATSNEVGEKLYRRSVLSGQRRYDRNCANYGSPDRAQRAFLDGGGPKRDKYGIDPDGDGFACAWNPSAFRNARGAALAPVAEPVTEGAVDGAVSASELAAAGITGTQAPVVPVPGDTMNISGEN